MKGISLYSYIMKLALIGNGPISREQKAEIESYDYVVRLARIDNFCIGEKMTHLCLDGLGQKMGNPRYKGLLLDNSLKNEANVMVFIDKNWEFLIEKNKEMGYVGQSVHFPIENKQKHIKMLQCQNLSLGYKSFLYAKTFDCPVHLYGFNWHPIMKEYGHNHVNERNTIVSSPDVFLHETPTSNLRNNDIKYTNRRSFEHHKP
jgi:hypothetical protein